DDFRRNAGFVALEVDRTQFLLVSATAMPAGQVARIAAPGIGLLRRRQRLVWPIRRKVIINDGRSESLRRRQRSVCLDCHKNLFSTSWFLLFALFPLCSSLET